LLYVIPKPIQPGLKCADVRDVDIGNGKLTRTVKSPRRSDLSLRLHRVLSSAELDCECRTKLDQALDRFSVLEARRQLRSALKEARHRRDLIADQISYLADIDEITENETDISVFKELALLFDEIADQADKAADALRELETLSAQPLKRNSD